MGIIFSRIGTYTAAKKQNVNKATKAMYDVLKKGRLHNLSVGCQYDLFDKIVKQILLYGCEIWGFSNLEIIERLHLKFCKILLGLKKSTPSFMVYGELGTYPMYISVYNRMVNFWANIVNGKVSKLSSILYRFSYGKYLQKQFQSPWITAISNILNNAGLGNIWQMQGNFNQHWLKNSVKLRLQDQFKQKWQSDVENSSKGTTYRLFKQCFEFEKYLDILQPKDAIVLCAFRVSNHRLPIETGRWKNIDRQHRFCEFCEERELGDEYHCLLQCKSLIDERKQYLPKYYQKSINVIKFSKLFQSKNIILLRNLCKFIRVIKQKST